MCVSQFVMFKKTEQVCENCDGKDANYAIKTIYCQYGMMKINNHIFDCNQHYAGCMMQKNVDSENFTVYSIASY